MEYIVPIQSGPGAMSTAGKWISASMYSVLSYVMGSNAIEDDDFGTMEHDETMDDDVSKQYSIDKDTTVVFTEALNVRTYIYMATFINHRPQSEVYN